MSGLMTAWAAQLVIITYRASKQPAGNPIGGLALPSQYASSFIIYGALGLIPDSGKQFATAVGWGLVVATLLNLWTPGGQVSATASNQSAATNADTGVTQKGA
jgi:hypothetical protein